MFEQLLSLGPAYRIHYFYLLPSLLLAFFLVKNWKIFNLHYLFNPSALLDLKLLIFNKVFKTFVLLPLEAGILFSTLKFLNSHLEFLRLESAFLASSSLILISFTLLSFLIDDGTRFLVHVAMHKIPFLWEFHKVHHSAPSLNPLTLYRVHTFELLLFSSRRIFSTCLSLVLFWSFSTGILSVAEIAGVHVFNFIFNLAGSNLRHSHLFFGFGAIEKYFISPAQHQIHHSKNPEHFDKNFGSCLSLWDRMYGSLIYSKCAASKPLKFGINYKERNHSYKSLSSALTHPISSSIKKLTPTIWKETMKKIILIFSLFAFTSCGEDSPTSKIQKDGTPPAPKSFSDAKYSEKVFMDFYQKELESLDQNLVKLSKTKDIENSKPLFKNIILSFQKISPLRDIGLMGTHDWVTYYYQRIYDEQTLENPCYLAKRMVQDKELLSYPPLNDLEVLIYQMDENPCSGNVKTAKWFEDSETVKFDRLTYIKRSALRTQELLRPVLKQIQDLNKNENLSELLDKGSTVQTIYESLTHFADKSLKDLKLGRTTGKGDRKFRTCIKCLELQSSKLSYEALIKNYEGFSLLFSGTLPNEDQAPAQGLAQKLLTTKFSSLATQVRRNLKDSYNILENLKDSNMIEDLKKLESKEEKDKCRANSEDQHPLCSLYSLAKELSDYFKNDIKIALELKAAAATVGDGD